MILIDSVYRKGSMRKTLETISLADLALQAAITFSVLYGPGRLPNRIPTHFDMAGHPNGWGSPSMLLLLLLVAGILYLLMTTVARYPSVFNYPVRVTAENRPRLEELALGMIAWLKAEMLCLFAWIQWVTIQSARHPQQGIPGASAPVFIAVIFVTVGWFIVAMFRAGQATPGA
jgi:uncharacterized membrane protein